jgi:N-acetylmuramoyl-L-alanine amidase
MSRTIYFSSGHSNVSGKDRGAAGNGLIEGVEAVKVKKRVCDILRQMYNKVAVVDPDENVLSQTIAYFRNKTTNKCIVVDFHLNASSNPAATGTETLIPSVPTQFEIDLAYALSHVGSKNLGIKKRGNYKGKLGVRTELESHHGRLGFMRLTGENVLIELFFITNPNEVKSYLENFEEYCQDVALVLYKFSIDKQNEILQTIN